MLILSERYGQLCNRLFQFAHLIAFCRARNLRIANLAFAPYSQYFDSMEEKLFISFPVSSYRLRNNFIRNILHQLFCNSARFCTLFFQHLMPRFPEISVINFDKEIPNSTEKLDERRSNSLVFVDGWYFRDYYDFKKYADEIRTYFRPKERYIDIAREIHRQIRQDSDMIIGLHIRRQDYKYWNNGKYYFDDEVYVKIIQKIILQFPDNNLKVLIASDEPLCIENYDCVHNTVVWNMREDIVDLMALAHCDYIVGAPSTFSAWASFYGKVPLLFIEDPDQTIDLKNAAIVDG